ncbi:MAG: hypothetical protein A2918_03930 [Candidatus Yanofskybacteria bacterium RIFCSPLOWO2_01_FULL_42_49]|uniref:Uncharacterized protein n=1 Tax=Candidatus Yanofskybacteria bacterium RIFCSPLOWO2_01_FULL_42_49 TaxID=1802694 RepID=A0A1F8GEK6_9BACT|nr:MAG: hypothetical protein A2918_03930 [Candidatus Yanofskybacteria bacterium RIFCSPLOWO2_01_FULL_42_49]
MSGAFKNNNSKAVAVEISIIGYAEDIFFLQFLHRPSRIKWLRTGSKSNHLIVDWQMTHLDLPLIMLRPVLNLNKTTLKKLPIERPIKNIKT